MGTGRDLSVHLQIWRINNFDEIKDMRFKKIYLYVINHSGEI